MMFKLLILNFFFGIIMGLFLYDLIIFSIKKDVFFNGVENKIV